MTLFGDPLDYLMGVEPHHPGPMGLTGGDCRRWTHEVRRPDEVSATAGQLQAAFAPVGRITADMERFFEWCKWNAVDRIVFRGSRRDDFETLRRACVDYIRRNLLP